MRPIVIISQAVALLLALPQLAVAAPHITRSLSASLRRREYSQCGRNSEGGNKKCPLNTCCSYSGYCGTEPAYCGSTDPAAPCQVGFGSCRMVPSPSCSGKSAENRKIGYYLSYSYSRSCDTVKPSNIVTTGFTHINFAFALFDGVNFDFYPQRSGDENIYESFTALKTSSLQTWIAIGGGEFNDPAMATKDNWAKMSSSSANRAKWISNLIKFMEKYGFQGADLDWEWPGDTTRGGTAADTANLVLLVKEVRAAFGTKYGLSSVLVTDIQALQYTDVKGIEKYVDFFNFMSYDYHIPSASPPAGSRALSHTNTTETDSKLDPLWFAGIAPEKVNLGLAYYGVAYKMQGSGCNGVNCIYTGIGTAGSCTKTAGHLSNTEIKRIVAGSHGTATTILLSDAMVKQTTYGNNQLVLHDDDETYALKTNFASSRCLGGTMVWSLDQA